MGVLRQQILVLLRVLIKPAQPVLVGRRKYEYTRHGTLCLTQGFNIITGMIHAILGKLQLDSRCLQTTTLNQNQTLLHSITLLRRLVQQLSSFRINATLTT